MTPEKREELTRNLAGHGLSVMLSKDFDSILIQLARLAEFERLIVKSLPLYPSLNGLLQQIKTYQRCFTFDESPRGQLMELVDIPAILSSVNRELQLQLDQSACFDQADLPAATAAFIGILCRR